MTWNDQGVEPGDVVLDMSTGAGAAALHAADCLDMSMVAGGPGWDTSIGALDMSMGAGAAALHDVAARRLFDHDHTALSESPPQGAQSEGPDSEGPQQGAHVSALGGEPRPRQGPPQPGAPVHLPAPGHPTGRRSRGGQTAVGRWSDGGVILANDVGSKRFMSECRQLRTSASPRLVLTAGRAAKFPCVMLPGLHRPPPPPTPSPLPPVFSLEP